MLDNIKKNLYFNREELLFNQGVADKRIVPFDDDFYEKLSHTYVSCLPVSINIKYLKPMIAPGKCYDRSLYMFFCFDDALLVRGDNKDLEYRYGKEDAGHGWIEIGNYVYDPTLLMRFDKDLYYQLYQPVNVIKCNKDEYCSSSDCKELFDSIRSTTIDDFKPNGNKRIELLVVIPLVLGIAEHSNNQEFIDELNDFMSSIQYDEDEILKEMDDKETQMMNLIYRRSSK